jgi:AraC family transcriptional regulator, carnitine catabolism transcriptional activator
MRKSTRADKTSLLPGPLTIVLIPHFTMIALSSILEPLRIANRYIARPYVWRLVSVDGEAVPDRNGVKVAVEGALDSVADGGALIVVADAPASRRIERALLPRLRRLARAGMMICGVDTAPFLLARSGLLDGRTATAHWEVLDAFRDQFPRVNTTARLYEIDGARCTCAGGSAALDLMLLEIETSFGRQLAQRVSEHCMHGRMRPQMELQRDLRASGAKAPGRKLARAIQVMERESPRRARIDAVAQAVGVSRRQLHRIFVDELATSPNRFRLKLRLEQARQMLANGDASVTEAALASGFSSRSHFSRCYSREFGRPPRNDKR